MSSFYTKIMFLLVVITVIIGNILYDIYYPPFVFEISSEVDAEIANLQVIMPEERKKKLTPEDAEKIVDSIKKLESDKPVHNNEMYNRKIKFIIKPKISRKEKMGNISGNADFIDDVKSSMDNKIVSLNKYDEYDIYKGIPRDDCIIIYGPK